MQILISLSKEEYVKGDRVAYKAGKDEWYVGTVSSNRNGLVGLLFDDGVKGAPSKPSARTWKRVGGKKYKKPLTDAQVAKIEVGAAPKAKVKEPVAKTRRAVKPVKSQVKEKTTSKLSKLYEHEVDKVTAEEKALVTAIKLSQHYPKGKSTRAQRITYLQAAWRMANKTFFDNKLMIPHLRLMKDMGTKFNRRGQWISSVRDLAVSPRLFLGSEAHVLTTLVHEMCHQATCEIDRVYKEANRGHGPIWSNWMRKCNLTPARYSKYDNENFMTDAEKAEHNRVKTNKEKALEAAPTEGRKRLFHIYNNTPAQFFDGKLNMWVKGLIVAPNDQARKRWMFITQPYSDRWKIIPSDWFYELPEAEKAKFKSQDFQRAAGSIVGYKDTKRAQRANNRGISRLMRATLGLL